MKTTRREFIDLIVTIGAGAGLVAAGCGDDGGGGGDSSMMCAPVADIGSNHSHALTIPSAHVTAGTAQTYTFTGSSPHNHDVTISAMNFAQLQSGGTVTTGSTSGGGDGHNHSVTIRCA